MVEISVIIPVYNVEEYLRQCLDSVINQTFDDIEIICVNDGSTDRSLDVLNEYESMDSRVKIISKEHEGVSIARARGLEAASGEYIYFVDSDDYIELTALEEMHKLSKEKNLDLLIFKLVNFDDDGNENWHYSDMPYLLEIPKETFTYHDFKENLFNVDVTIYTKFFSHDLASKIRFPENLIFEDSAAYFDYILNAKRIHFYDKCLYHRHIRDNSLITKASKNYVDVIEIYGIIEDKLKEYGVYDELKEYHFSRKVDIIYYRFKLINPEYKQYFFDEMKKDFISWKDEYENSMDLTKITNYYKSIFEAVIQSENPDEIEAYREIYKLKNKLDDLKKENKKLKRENKRLKKHNESILSSNSWKITKPLRNLKGR